MRDTSKNKSDSIITIGYDYDCAWSAVAHDNDGLYSIHYDNYGSKSCCFRKYRTYNNNSQYERPKWNKNTWCNYSCNDNTTSSYYFKFGGLTDSNGKGDTF